jgi:hypothetical protein
MSDASREYGEGQASIPAIDEPTVIFMINNTLPKESWSVEDVYGATRCCWKIGAAARERTVIALGVSHGVVRGAYQIDRWTDASKEAGQGRWCFDGRPATDINVVGTSIARIKAPRGQANPVRAFLDGIPPATPND